MNFNLKLFSIILSLIISSTNFYAQTDKFIFNHFTSENGLSQNFVSCILQDQKGFMWFGTKDGLNRFDGYEFKIFRNNPFDSTTISGNSVTALFEDKNGNLWIGSEGLDVFNPVSEEVKRITLFNNKNENDHYIIKAINIDKNDKLWIGTNNGLYIFDPINFKVISHFTFPKNKDLASNDIRAIIIEDNNIYLGAENGLNVVQLYNKDYKNIIFTKPNLIDEHKKNFSSLTISALFRSRSGVLFAGTPKGLLRIDLANSECRLFTHDKTAFKEQWKGRIISICADKSNNLWLASSGALVIFNPVTEKYKYIYQDPVNMNSINFDGILCVYSDRSGKIWLGTAGKGINLYDEYRKEFKLYNGYFNKEPFQASFSVNSILKDDKNNLWIVANGNLYILKNKSDEYEKIVLKQIRNSAILSLVEDDQGNIWIVTDYGFFKYNSANNNITEFEPIKIKPKSADENHRYLFRDSKGNLWFSYANYLCKYDRSNNCVNIDLTSVIKSYQTNYINYIYEGIDGYLWIASADRIIKVNPTNYSVKPFPYKTNDGKFINYFPISSIVEDPIQPSKFLWLGTKGGGLIRFSKTDNSYTHFLVQDGLPNNIIYSVLSSKNEFWLSTNNGICRVRTDKYGNPVFRNYDVTDGLQGNEFNTGAFYKSKDGEIFFGGLYGITAFFPDKIRDNVFIPPISLVDLTILTPIYSKEKDKPHQSYKIPIAGKNKITLPYDQNTFTIDFTALDFTAPKKNNYIYQLKKLNDSPVEIGTQRSVTFTDLASGEYEFIVKGSNNDGIWNEKGASIKIIITPPFWKTLWAYVLYFILLISILLLIRKYEMNRIKLKNNLKQESFEREKLKEIDVLKSKFFTNISHEFRTPLTLIMGPAQQLESDEIDTEKKEKLSVIKSNANRLLRLINQLLDLSKIESGASKIRCTEDDIVSFINSIATSFIPLAERKRISLEVKTSIKELKTYFDKDVIEKIFYNLISNAFKFTPKNGKISIDITTTNNGISPTNNFIKITVKDSGEGISNDKLELIFNKFYQINTYADNYENGSGIGLAFVKELISIHHGSITVESEIGIGSVFTVKIPVGKEYLAEDEIFVESNNEDNVNNNSNKKPEKKLLELSNSSNTTDTLIVLVVEDNLDVQNLIRKQLEKEYKIITAINGKDGYEKAVLNIPDLIISDLMMPDYDGIELCNKLKEDERTSHIPIIILTAKADENDKIEGLATGVDDYLTKPFSFKELQQRVKNLIEIRKILRQKFSSSIVLKPKEINASSVDKLFLEKALNIVEKNINNENFTVKDFSNEMNLSHSQLHRKLKALTNQSANHFIRSVRMERALELLKSNAGNIAEIAYLVGYNDPGYFTKIFSSYFGYLPSEANNLS